MGLFQGIGNFFSGAANKVGNFVSNTASKVGDFVSNNKDKILGALEYVPILGDAIGAGKDLYNFGKGIADGNGPKWSDLGSGLGHLALGGLSALGVGSAIKGAATAAKVAGLGNLGLKAGLKIGAKEIAKEGLQNIATDAIATTYNYAQSRKGGSNNRVNRYKRY